MVVSSSLTPREMDCRTFRGTYLHSLNPPMQVHGYKFGCSTGITSIRYSIKPFGDWKGCWVNLRNRHLCAAGVDCGGVPPAFT